MKRKQILFTLLLIFIIYCILIEPNLITVKRLNLKSDIFPKMRIVFVTDFHLSKFARLRLKRIVNKVNKLEPDLVISGGDYALSHDIKKTLNPDIIAEELSKIESRYGFYTVFGNHDYYKDGDEFKRIFKKHNINILENSNVKIVNGEKLFYLAGIPDMLTARYDLDKALYKTLRPVILVSHTPDITPLAQDKVDLILSGHLHGGQVRVPFFGALYLPSKYGKKYETGLIDNVVYVSRGLGTSLFKIRFNCSPEITVIDYN